MSLLENVIMIRNTLKVQEKTNMTIHFFLLFLPKHFSACYVLDCGLYFDDVKINHMMHFHRRLDLDLWTALDTGW